MAPELPGRPVHPEEMDAKFQQWRAIVDKMHDTTRFTPNAQLYWTPLSKPLAESTVALVSTAGVRLQDQEPYDLMNPHGDASYRVIPGHADLREIVVEHSHYDTTDANTDPNVVFPLDRLRELEAEGTVGGISTVHAGMMGWNPDGARVRVETAPAIAEVVRAAGADVAILTPG